ncbi:MAG: hypothetical protein Q8L37_00110 [Candidatus Gottesmanbacteria bacterium]|nr:hypothetical protein [Candidatus Gottesmanbacteria bacterium]
MIQTTINSLLFHGVVIAVSAGKVASTIAGAMSDDVGGGVSGAVDEVVMTQDVCHRTH